MTKILVSVIMPCLDSEKTIAESIGSVLAQDYKDIELIIIDDGSSDRSLDIIERYLSCDNRVKLIRNSGTHGVSYARNEGLSAASGRFICFLDSDDYLLPGSISRRVKTFCEKNAKIVYGSYLKLLPNGSFSLKSAPTRVSLSEMLRKNYIGNLTGMYDADFFGKVQQEPIRHEDYLMWCRFLKLEKYAYSTDSDPLGVYRVSSNSLSGNKMKAFVWHWVVLRRGLQINALVGSYYQLFYFIASVFERTNDLLKRVVK
jgi:teichuronic acid biosynthesis glycosyltransferase TuaG